MGLPSELSGCMMRFIQRYHGLDYGLYRRQYGRDKDFPFQINCLESFTTMKMKSQVVIAGLLFAGLLATGCSQQQSTGGQQVSEPAPAPAPVVPAPAPVVPAPAPVPVVPHVKAKGNYKGPVMMDPASAATMQQYQK